MLAKTLLIPLFALGVVSAAGATEVARQCPAPWSKVSCAEPAGNTCQVSDTSSLRQLGYDDAPQHVLTKAEARAELDAIKISANAQLADERRMPQRPASGE